MSRLDFHDFSCPPGLIYTRSTSEIDHMSNNYPSNSPTHPVSGDRRMSNGFSVYPPNTGTSAIPRSIAIHPDKEYSSIGMLSEPFQAPPNRQTSTQHLSSSNHHRPPPPSLPHSTSPAALTINTDYYNAPSDPEREAYLHRQLQSPSSKYFVPSGDLPLPANSNSNLTVLRSTLWWGELEPWMDEEYAKQVCALMGWDPVTVKVPNPGPDATTAQPTNNSGYCYLTFPSPAIASSVLNQVNGGGNAQPITMPNSNKPFVLNWASSAPTGPVPPSFPTAGVIVPTAHPQFPKEYSIFVGDLAPETSNSDLVAVFRNPVLGLRNDREPKFIRPFLSCKSAKIMLDPVTGISRGYGFVRFTEESDQQRALIEMHGLYCLSRPMRISPATAKFKPPPMPTDLPQIQFPGSPGSDQRPNPVTVALPLGGQARSVSAPIAASTGPGSSSALPCVPVGPSASGSTLSGSSSIPSLGSEASTVASSGALSSMSSDEMLGLSADVLALAQQYANAGSNSNGKSIVPSGSAHDSQDRSVAPRYIISEESWKHHAQARAILGNLIGPNGEQLTSTDPYNTTVFVGGLSPLISEETLRTFFTPFGEIHYVKVPVGKHCGFVQFVRKADAERAIEKMQGFPIGGSRIRLSWGRSQYKAAQAAAQAAQAAALQAQFQAQMASAQGQAPAPQSQMTPEQAIQLLQRLGLTGQGQSNGASDASNRNYGDATKGSGYSEEKLRSLIMNQPLSDGQLPYDVYPVASGPRPPSNLSSVEHHNRSHLASSFSPFSPDPNMYTRRGSDSYDLLPHSMNHGSRYDNIMEFKAATANPNERPVPPVRTPNGSQRYVPFMDGSAKSFESGRCLARQEPISRPNSSQTSSQGRSSQYDGQEEHDPIHDLNGTLASLDLDQHHPWKSQGSDNRPHPSSSS
ncbi:uncharacterized protein EDB91DRAFT_1243270 [Suillus paluster]|uniref:uncharacterized protein n=1 Tax=Suillus paluster TaxID=48578 RepID=UPI001B87F8BD|nr:uncharacterized protein EDB91DRAFT_1243270 [Suillus paluster]KAG1752510.1 hypothetical protein EDB91DRAFT_1243270 [Suillus paluster]